MVTNDKGGREGKVVVDAAAAGRDTSAVKVWQTVDEPAQETWTALHVVELVV